MNSDHQPTLESPLSPAEFLERLRAETVPYEAIFNIRAPASGYATFLEHALTGSKTVISKIDKHSFMLMPIGVWPVKGQVALANAGALHGTVEAVKTGSRISAHYRPSIGIVVFLAVFAAFTAGLVTLVAVVTVLFPAIEGLLLLQGLASASVVFTVFMAAYYWVSGRKQRQLLEVFLRKLCTESFHSTNDSPDEMSQLDRSES
jgi:hypothetical protein